MKLALIAVIICEKMSTLNLASQAQKESVVCAASFPYAIKLALIAVLICKLF